MKTSIILSLLMAAFLSHPLQKAPRDGSFPAPGINPEQIHERTTLTSVNSIANIPNMHKKKKKRKKNSHKRKNHKVLPYRVIACAPTLAYTISRIGNENRVMFCINGGNVTIPNSISFEHDSGMFFEIDKKKGFENVQFPFTCSLYTPISYIMNPFNNWPARLNGFKIEIDQPGDWVISFSR